MQSDVISNLQAPGQVVANFIDAVFPVGGAALVIYTIYSVGQSWFDAGQKAVGALGFLSRWARDRRATPEAVSAWKAVRPLFLLVTAGLWVAATYVQANLFWTFFVTESRANGQVNSKGMPALIVAQDFSVTNLWGHGTPMARPLVYFAVLALIIAFVSRRGWWVGLATFLAGMPSGLLGLFMALDAVVAFVGALQHTTSWSSFLFAAVGLAACCMYWWLCVIGLSSAKALGELARPTRTAFS